MARMTEAEREFKRELTQHLWHRHGEFRNETNLSLEHLEKLHQMLHTDNYACPPHEHKDAGPYDLGRIKLTMGKGYLKMIRKVAGGDLG